MFFFVKNMGILMQVWFGGVYSVRQKILLSFLSCSPRWLLERQLLNQIPGQKKKKERKQKGIPPYLGVFLKEPHYTTASNSG